MEGLQRDGHREQFWKKGLRWHRRYANWPGGGQDIEGRRSLHADGSASWPRRSGRAPRMFSAGVVNGMPKICSVQSPRSRHFGTFCPDNTPGTARYA
jgi:hypothetical protein